MPVKRLVKVIAPCLATPRTDMQVCSASIMTATPRGFSTSSIAAAADRHEGPDQGAEGEGEGDHDRQRKDDQAQHVPERHLLGEYFLRHDQDLVDEEEKEKKEERDDERDEVFPPDVPPGDLGCAPSAASSYTETPPPRVPKKTLGGLQAIAGTSIEASPSWIPMRRHEPSVRERTLTPPPKLPKYSARSVSQPERIQSSAISGPGPVPPKTIGFRCRTHRPSPYVPIQILPSRAGRIIVMFSELKPGAGWTVCSSARSRDRG